MSIPRYAIRSSTFREVSGTQTKGINASRIISGENLNYQNGLESFLRLNIALP
jgi:hypothetical protein